MNVANHDHEDDEGVNVWTDIGDNTGGEGSRERAEDGTDKVEEGDAAPGPTEAS